MIDKLGLAGFGKRRSAVFIYIQIYNIYIQIYNIYTTIYIYMWLHMMVNRVSIPTWPYDWISEADQDV